MRLEDIKVGMKVVPINKTGSNLNYQEWIDYNTSIPNFFKENGYLYVIHINNSEGAIHLDCVMNNKCGDRFKAEDLKPYIEKKQKTKIQQETIIYEYQPYILTVTSESSKDNYEEVFVHNLEQERETVKVIFNGDTTICILEDGSKGIAKRNPNDAYDKDKAQNIAHLRARIKSLEKEIEKPSKY